MWIGKQQWQELWKHVLKTNEEMGEVQKDTTLLKQDTTILKLAVGKVKTSVGWLQWLVGLLVAGLIGFAFCVFKSVLP